MSTVRLVPEGDCGDLHLDSATDAPYRSAVSVIARFFAPRPETDAGDVDALLGRCARHMCELWGARRCSVYLLDPQREVFAGVAAHDSSGAMPRAQSERIKRLVAGTDADRFTCEIVATKRPVVVTDAQRDPRPVRSAMRWWGVSSMMGVPLVAGDEVVGIAFVDHGDERHVFSAQEAEVASVLGRAVADAVTRARATSDARTAADAAERQNQVLKAAMAADERLVRILVDGGTLSDLARTVTDLTGKPCEVVDRSARRLASAGDIAAVAFDMTPFVRSDHPGHRAAQEALGAAGAGRAQVVGPLLELGLQRRCALAPIQDHGLLVVHEAGSRLTGLDLHIARRAAAAAALSLAAEARAAAAKCDVREAFVADLLRGSADPTSLVRRAEHLGIDLTEPHVVCVVTADDPSEPAPGGLEWRARVEAAETTGLAGSVDGCRVAIMALDARLPPAVAEERLRAIVTALLEAPPATPRLRAAVSGRCAGPQAFPAGFREAREVLRCLRAMPRWEGRSILTARELGPGRVLLSGVGREDAERFADEVLGPLDAPGTANGGALLRSLQVFFDCGRSVRQTAEALDVHENTVRNRLARIEALTGLAVATSADDQLSAHLALVVRRLRGDDVSTAA